MTALEAVRLLIGAIAVGCSACALVVFAGDARWAAGDQRQALRIIAQAMLIREASRLVKVLLLVLATLGVILRDRADIGDYGEWQAFINLAQTAVLLLFSVATVFELYTRWQVFNLPRDGPRRRETDRG